MLPCLKGEKTPSNGGNDWRASRTAVQRRGRTPPRTFCTFAPEDRRLLDDALEQALSKGGSRDGVVAVTTQTAEQSLDIDADWLVTAGPPVGVDVLDLLHRGRERRPPRP